MLRRLFSWPMTNYQKLFYLHLFSSLSTLFPLITLFYLHRGATMFQVFLMAVIYSSLTLIFEIPTGMVGDRFGRRASIILGCLCLLFHGFFFIIAHSFLMLAIGFSFFVIARSFFSGSVEAFIYDSLKDEGKERQMNKYFGRYTSARYVPAIVIPLLAAYIARDLAEPQFLILLFISFVGYIIALFLSLSLKEPEHHKKQQSSLLLLKDSVKLLKTNKMLLRLALNNIFVSIIFVIYWRIWQPYFNSTLLIPIVMFGVFMSVFSLSTFLLNRNLEYLEEKIGIVRFLRLSAYIPLVAGIVFFLTKNIIVHTLILFAILIPIAVRGPMFSRYMNRHIESKNRATALSLISIMKSGIEIPFAIGIGFLASYFLPYALIPGIFLIVIALIFFRIREGHVRA